MPNVINLRRARKAKAREADAALAAANRALHGQTREQRERMDAEAAQTERALNNAQLTPDSGSKT